MDCTSSQRYFNNPYRDFDQSKDQSLTTENHFWTNYIEETFLNCTKHTKCKPSDKYCGGGLYTGSLGLIYTAVYLLKHGHCQKDAPYLKYYIESGLEANRKYFSNYQSPSDEIGFLCDKGGLNFTSCIVSNFFSNEHDTVKYANQYTSHSPICEPINFLRKGSDEVFVGRAGYLNGLFLMKKNLKIEPLPQAKLFKILDSMIESGKIYSLTNYSPCPLMYSYHGTEYIGAAHGLSGILQAILNFPEYLEQNPEAQKLVRNSIEFLLSTQKPNGNFPSSMHGVNSHEGKDLIHWCHGAAGVVHLMAKAYLIWSEEKFLDSCKRCSDLIWERGLLKKGPGICHGIAGNGYVHLLLYRLTKDRKYLYRAYKFADFLRSLVFEEEARTPDRPYSLFEGYSGTVCFIADLLKPDEAEFPLFPIF